MKWKVFSIIFEWLSMKQINKFFLEGESPTLNLASVAFLLNLRYEQSQKIMKNEIPVLYILISVFRCRKSFYFKNCNFLAFLQKVGFLYSAHYFHLTVIVSWMNFKNVRNFHSYLLHAAKEFWSCFILTSLIYFNKMEIL